MIFDYQNIKKIRIQALADKHECSSKYVYSVLSGERKDNSELAQAIIKDAQAIVDIIDERVNDNTNRFTDEMIKQKISA